MPSILEIRHVPDPPDSGAADHGFVAIRAAYRRFVAAWACDWLRLRRRGLDRPGLAADRDLVPTAWPVRRSA